MANKSEKVSNLKKELQRIFNLDRRRLISRQEWGTVNFEEVRTNINRSYILAQQLSILPVELLLEKRIDNIKECACQVASCFEQLDQWSIETAVDIPSTVTTYKDSVRQTTDQFFEAVAQWVPYLTYQRGDVEQNIAKLTRSVEEAEKKASFAKEKIAAQESEIEKIFDKARETSAGAGAAVFTKDFENVANKMEKSAKNWLWVTIFLAFSTLGASAGMWYWTESGLDQGQIFQKISTKMVVLAVLLTGTIWCGRNYRALKHLAIINNHRANSIHTLQAFSNAAAQTQTKDAVLMEATRAVFGNVPTGFIGQQTSSDSDIKVIEVARNILPESDSK